MAAEQKVNRPPPRVTVVETIYHQGDVGEPLAAAHNFQRVLATGAQPYGPRYLEVGETFVPLDFGWVEHPSYVCLRNDGAGPSPRVLSPEEQADADRRVLELAVLPTGTDELRHAVPFAVVCPGESLRVELVDPQNVVVRCRHGTTRVRLYAFPG